MCNIKGLRQIKIGVTIPNKYRGFSGGYIISLKRNTSINVHLIIHKYIYMRVYEITVARLNFHIRVRYNFIVNITLKSTILI